MKVLVILSRVPYPLEKGDKLRAYHQLKELKKRHEIVLCCLSDSPVNPKAHEALEEISDRFFIYRLSRWRIALRLIFGVFSRLPFQVLYFYQRSVHKTIRELIARESPDHIYCQLIRTAEYAKHEHNYRKTLDYQDAFSKGIERRQERSYWPLREIFNIERRRLIQYETIVFEYFESKTIISAEDRRFIYHPERKNIAIITNGIEPAFFHAMPDISRKYHLVFTGNMNYPPNIETAEYIVQRILPELRKVLPDTKILLAGSSPHKRVKQLADDLNVEVSGWVDDIREAYASAELFFAPMQIGTGLQNKLLEAMAMEIPSITSELANRSLKATPGEHLIVGETTADYVEAIVALLNDAQKRHTLGKAGRKFVETHFSWQQSVRKLEMLMENQNSTMPGEVVSLHPN